jgi:hypothetical protein
MLVALVCAAALVSACLGPPGPYLTTQFAGVPSSPAPAGTAGIVRGRPAPVVDGLNHYVLSLPSKLLYFNPRLYDHALPKESEILLLAYLRANQLEDKVLIRHNQWTPVGEWRRLRANTDVGTFYRYTIGLYYLGYYTLLPPRLFGGSFLSLGDRFNPYTNTISVYTSDVAFLLHEGGHAKDYSESRYKGTWGAWLEIPFGALEAEYYASADAVRFARCIGRDDLERSFVRRLTPAYGSYIGGYASYLVPGGQIVVAAGIGVGHVVGQVQAGMRWLAGGSGDAAAEPATGLCDPATIDAVEAGDGEAERAAGAESE